MREHPRQQVHVPLKFQHDLFNFRLHRPQSSIQSRKARNTLSVLHLLLAPVHQPWSHFRSVLQQPATHARHTASSIAFSNTAQQAKIQLWLLSAYPPCPLGPTK
jgi:hypothetical protein